MDELLQKYQDTLNCDSAKQLKILKKERSNLRESKNKLQEKVNLLNSYIQTVTEISNYIDDIKSSLI